MAETLRERTSQMNAMFTIFGATVPLLFAKWVKQRDYFTVAAGAGAILACYISYFCGMLRPAVTPFVVYYAIGLAIGTTIVLVRYGIRRLRTGVLGLPLVFVVALATTGCAFMEQEQAEAIRQEEIRHQTVMDQLFTSDGALIPGAYIKREGMTYVKNPTPGRRNGWDTSFIMDAVSGFEKANPADHVVEFEPFICDNGANASHSLICGVWIRSEHDYGYSGGMPSQAPPELEKQPVQP